MEVVKGELVLWTKSSTGFSLLIFSLISSMAFLIWSISLSKCGTLREVVPLDWLSGSIFPLPSWLWACPSAYSSCRLLELISLVNSWFWRVNSAVAVAMDCTCWTEDGCMTGAYWRSRRGLLEASLLSWWPGFVALNLVQTIQPSIVGQITKKFENSSHRQRQLIMLRKLVGWMAWILMNLRAWKRRDTKSEETRVDRPQTLRWWS